MERNRFGLSAALATPFDAQGKIDGKRAVDHARWCMANGCGGVTLFGTTGEGSSIGSDERRELLEAFRGAGVEPGRIVAGVMANSVVDAALQSNQALDAGCRGVLLAPPSYFKGLSDDGLFDWFAGVFEALGGKARGFYLYNIPSVTAIELSVDLVGRLRSAFPQAVAGVKDSSGNWNYTQALLASHRDLAILVGDERHLAAAVRLGGQGAISGMANVSPERLVAMAIEGRDDAALAGVVDDLLKFPVTAAVKALIAHRNGDKAWRRTRPPLRALTDPEAQAIGGAFDRSQRTEAA
jgi:4-hydroxy-tetrahydrodipicolinate synthase